MLSFQKWLDQKRKWGSCVVDSCGRHIAEDGSGSMGIVIAVTFGPSNLNSSEAVPEQILQVR